MAENREIHCQAVVFDMDGVIFDSERLVLKSWKKIGEKYGYAREAVVLQELMDAGLLPYFDRIIGGDMVRRSKPEPDIFLKACEKLGVTPGMAIVIEDSFHGIRAAKRAGMIPVMVPDLLMPDETITKLAYRIFPSLREVKAWLQRDVLP